MTLFKQLPQKFGLGYAGRSRPRPWEIHEAALLFAAARTCLRRPATRLLGGVQSREKSYSVVFTVTLVLLRNEKKERNVCIGGRFWDLFTTGNPRHLSWNRRHARESSLCSTTVDHLLITEWGRESGGNRSNEGTLRILYFSTEEVYLLIQLHWTSRHKKTTMPKSSVASTCAFTWIPLSFSFVLSSGVRRGS